MQTSTINIDNFFHAFVDLSSVFGDFSMQPQVDISSTSITEDVRRVSDEAWGFVGAAMYTSMKDNGVDIDE